MRDTLYVSRPLNIERFVIWVGLEFYRVYGYGQHCVIANARGQLDVLIGS